MLTRLISAARQGGNIQYSETLPCVIQTSCFWWLTTTEITSINLREQLMFGIIAGTCKMFMGPYATTGVAEFPVGCCFFVHL